MRSIRRMFQSGSPRWRVAILESDVSSRARLRAAVEDAGGVVAVEAPLRLDAVVVMKETRPDVVIMAPSLCGASEAAVMSRITAEVGCPAVLFTRDTDQAVVGARRAADRGPGQGQADERRAAR